MLTICEFLMITAFFNTHLIAKGIGEAAAQLG